MKNVCRAASVALVVALGACATVGRSFDTTHVPDVQQGQSKQQMQDWFGAPTHTAPLTNSAKGCVERWQWVHASATVATAAKSQALIVDFDPSGNVCDHAYAEQ